MILQNYLPKEVATLNKMLIQKGLDKFFHPLRFFKFFSPIDDKTSAPDVFSSCSFIPIAHSEASVVIVSCYGYEI